MSVHEFNHQMQTYCERKKNHGTASLTEEKKINPQKKKIKKKLEKKFQFFRFAFSDLHS